MTTTDQVRILNGNTFVVSDERGQMRPATAEEKALAAQQPVVIGASIPVRASDKNEV